MIQQWLFYKLNYSTITYHNYNCHKGSSSYSNASNLSTSQSCSLWCCCCGYLAFWVWIKFIATIAHWACWEGGTSHAVGDINTQSTFAIVHEVIVGFIALVANTSYTTIKTVGTFLAQVGVGIEVIVTGGVPVAVDGNFHSTTGSWEVELIVGGE